MQVPAAGDPAVEEVGEAGVEEEGEGVEVLVGDDEVADCGGGDQAREGEDVGDGVDVLVAEASGDFGFERGGDGG